MVMLSQSIMGRWDESCSVCSTLTSNQDTQKLPFSLFPFLRFSISQGKVGSHRANCTINTHTPEYMRPQWPRSSSLTEIMQVNRYYWNRCSVATHRPSVHIYQSSRCHGRWIHSVWCDLPFQKNPIWNPKSRCLNLGVSTHWDWVYLAVSAI